MTQIQKRNNNLPSVTVEKFKSTELTFYGADIDPDIELSKAEQQFLEHINYLPVAKISHDELTESVFVMVANNLRALSSNMQAKDMVLLTNDLVTEIEADFPQFSIKEIEIIIRNGIRGKYDTSERYTVGFSIVNFNLWARAYTDIKFRMNLDLEKKLNKEKTTTEVPITNDSLMELMKRHYLHHQIKFSQIPVVNRKGVKFEKYFQWHGLDTSSKFIFNQLIKLNLVIRKDLEKEVKILKHKNYAPAKREFFKLGETGTKSLEDEAKRIYCCKYYLKNK